jgi:hypothetical protein
LLNKKELQLRVHQGKS